MIRKYLEFINPSDFLIVIVNPIHHLEAVSWQ